MFSKILLPTDGSAHSLRSAEYAVSLAKMSEGTIDIIYAIDDKASQIDVLTTTSKYAVTKKRKEKLSATIELLKKEGIEHTIHFVHGEPGPTIVEFANKGNYDCVVVGSRGLNKFQTMVLGSVSHKVVKRVNVPVLVVK
ncbi:universal stress protein [bacterium LRH843]|nr:universal stress protein [bacterium LRH843]